MNTPTATTITSPGNALMPTPERTSTVLFPLNFRLTGKVLAYADAAEKLMDGREQN